MKAFDILYSLFNFRLVTYDRNGTMCYCVALLTDGNVTSNIVDVTKEEYDCLYQAMMEYKPREKVLKA